MKLRLKSAVAGVAALAIASVGVVAVAGSASAYTGTPPWESPADSAAKGSLTFYDAAGTVITGGSNYNNLAAYISTSTATRAGTNKVTLQVAAPDHTNPIVAGWPFNQAQAAYTFTPTPAGTPASVTGTGFVKLSAFGAAISDVASGFAGVGGFPGLDNTAQYQNVLQLRLIDTGPGVAADGNYWRADIEFNPAAAGGPTFDGLAPQAWKVIFPAPVAAITTSVSTPVATPASPQTFPVTVGLSATVSAADSSHPAGSVAFFDGATNVGAATFNAATGVATLAGLSPAAGTHPYTAVFTPATAAYSGSTSSALSYVVNGPAAATTTALGAFTGIDGTNSIAQPAAVGGSAVVTKTSDSSVVAVGSVSFFSGATLIATDANGADGFSFNVSSSGLPLGANVITAVFTDGAAFLGSTSPAATITVTAATYAADKQYIQTSIAPGNLVISTPYNCATAACTGPTDNPLILPVMALNATATEYKTSAPFAGISVTDTRPGNLAYTLSALSSNLNKAGVPVPGANEIINSQNVGLTGLALTSTNATPNTFLGGVPAGGPFAGQNLTGFDNAAAAHLGAAAAGSAGLGGAAPHAVLHANTGLGTTVVNGLLTITAPTNTIDGTYSGTVTFTILGS